MRKDNVAYLGANGKWVKKGSNSCELSPTGDIGIGGTPNGGERTPAFFDEFRVSKDVARFDISSGSDFTVPTKPYCGGYKSKC
jgi:hypothetical protein